MWFQAMASIYASKEADIQAARLRCVFGFWVPQNWVRIMSSRRSICYILMWIELSEFLSGESLRLIEFEKLAKHIRISWSCVELSELVFNYLSIDETLLTSISTQLHWNHFGYCLDASIKLYDVAHWMI